MRRRKASGSPYRRSIRPSTAPRSGRNFPEKEIPPPLAGVQPPRRLLNGCYGAALNFREIGVSNQQSILLGLLGTGPRILKGRPAQTNKSKWPGRGHSKPLRRGDQAKDSGGEIDQAKYSTSPKGEEEAALWLRANSYEYSDGGSGELSGDDLAMTWRGSMLNVGPALPRSRGFGDKVWRSKCDGTS
ncbi:hypothetical protein Acr_10g0004080 [Actinidia rufa]|uniref:Uncharacterized protein n=1 Tax=Actinidia rufa TaxID=165716 RepID=A0A7J0F8T9_9ERIC|nr:hypothetical protein Acr_10g0004080 [Actinidia rufa]